MSNMQPLEDDVRRALRASADALVVEDRDFDPDRAGTVGLREIEPERTRRAPLRLLVAAVVIVVLVSAIVVVRQTGGSNGSVTVAETPTTRTTSTADALLAQVASVPADVLATVGKGSVNALPVGLPGPVLATTDGKPRIVWIGAEYCPFCAAQRWALVQALSRFGTFSGLKTTTSPLTTQAGGPEVFPGTPGFSFAGAVYNSDYLKFESVEQETNTYQPLETPTPEQQQLFQKYDAPPYVDAQSTGAIPLSTSRTRSFRRARPTTRGCCTIAPTPTSRARSRIRRATSPKASTGPPT
jgi:hypothetical protein